MNQQQAPTGGESKAEPAPIDLADEILAYLADGRPEIVPQIETSAADIDNIRETFHEDQPPAA